MRGPVISNDRHKQTLLRGSAPQNPTAPGVIRVSNPYYRPSTSTQPQYMDFIPTPGFQQMNAPRITVIYVVKIQGRI